MKRAIAVILFIIGIEEHQSIHKSGFPTYGYGKLLQNGFFKYNLPEEYLLNEESIKLWRNATICSIIGFALLFIFIKTSGIK